MEAGKKAMLENRENCDQEKNQCAQDEKSNALEAAYTMTDTQFSLWSELLRERTGMVLPVERRSFLITSIALRMREVGVDTYAEYYRILNSGVSGEVEWTFLIDRLTVHETRFFRHLPSLDVVRAYVRNKKMDANNKVSIQVWSAGCSTGEEAYSLAITLDQAIRLRTETCYYGVTATDISEPSIKAARRGVYSERRVRDLGADLLQTYFEKLDNERYRVTKVLRKRVCFTPMNILAITKKNLGRMDIIFCQNLLIYFDRGRRFQIVDALAEHLVPGGLLVLGSGELVHWGHPAMQKLNTPGTLVFQRSQPPVDNTRQLL